MANADQLHQSAAALLDLVCHRCLLPQHDQLSLVAVEEDDEQQQPADTSLQPDQENPFDQQSTQIILAAEQHIRQRLLGRQIAQLDGAAALQLQGERVSSVKLQQAEQRIQQLQR